MMSYIYDYIMFCTFDKLGDYDYMENYTLVFLSCLVHWCNMCNYNDI